MMSYFNPDEFIELLVKYHDGQASRKEVLFVERQLKESDLARNLWEDVQATFAEEDAEAAAARQQQRRRYRPYWLAAAAIVLLLIAGDSIFVHFRQQQRTPVTVDAPKTAVLQLADGQMIPLERQAGRLADAARSVYAIPGIPAGYTSGPHAQELNTLSVPKGYTYALLLPDSTAVYINAATDIRFPFRYNAQRREVHIAGEAYFEIAPDATRPFIVHTQQADIIALGTSFNVNTYDNGLRASLLTGAVVIMEKNKMVQLSPGQVAIKDPSTGSLVVDTFRNDTLPTWMDGRYYFNNKTLQEVCRTAERLYDITIIFDKAEIAQYRYTGAIHQKRPVAVFVKNIGGPNKIDYYFDKQGKLHLR
ncbi:FecR family protein [Chitinophaga japonensis]|uniref:FecR family protein n=1 Tax=Chitinophaga japonensis TaxID=104662 RepID=A0A562ST15_CHIJA|nr:FecR domain-containing protein [Chitinophaga japonensis]TWI84352.1 FecR family protein [Chitinophaga japonensis]